MRLCPIDKASQGGAAKVGRAGGADGVFAGGRVGPVFLIEVGWGGGGPSNLRTVLPAGSSCLGVSMRGQTMTFSRRRTLLLVPAELQNILGTQQRLPMLFRNAWMPSSILTSAVEAEVTSPRAVPLQSLTFVYSSARVALPHFDKLLTPSSPLIWASVLP